MDEPLSDCASILSFSCPRCGHEHQDDYEVIDLVVPNDWRCMACARIFSVLLTECPHCTTETVTVALTEAEQPAAADVRCTSCGKRGRHSHDEVEGEVDG